MAAEIPANFVNSTLVTTIAFFLCVVAIFYRASAALEKKQRLKFTFLVLAVLIAWFTIVSLLGKIRFFVANPLLAPNIILLFLAIFIFLQKVYKSPGFQKIADNLPLPWAIGVQTYRIVGVGFLILYNLGLLPAAFAFPSGYGDILVGLLAPLVTFFYLRKTSFSRKLAVFWNYLGIADLVMALSLGSLAFPIPYQTLPTTVSTEIFALFPMILIPGFAVPLAFFLHLLSLRVLNNEKMLSKNH